MKKIFVNGSFDIIHRGHVELLKYAKGLGDFLVVAIDTDNRIKHLKGQSRPINNQWDRKFILENLSPVDDVCFFESDAELVALIKTYAPDIMVKGSDYIGKTIIGSEHCKEIKFYDRTEHSTTKTIQDIVNRG
jgi:D-beta-D-heptose 7-phosphate kinase/D-beta-D-heptose 1-phosphate adenosyltransferase